MLKERGYFSFPDSNGETVKIRFSTYALMLFCESEGDMTLQEFLVSVSESLKLRQVANLMLCAYTAANEGHNKTAKDAAGWIDDLGGISGAGVLEMLGVLVSSLKNETEGGKSKKAISR
jgi:hypothetical protein